VNYAAPLGVGGSVELQHCRFKKKLVDYNIFHQWCRKIFLFGAGMPIKYE
jgi:hypothetical protein